MGVRIRRTYTLRWTWRDYVFWSLVAGAGVTVLVLLAVRAPVTTTSALSAFVAPLPFILTIDQPRHARRSRYPVATALVDALISIFVDPIARLARAVWTLVRLATDWVKLFRYCDPDTFWPSAAVTVCLVGFTVINLVGSVVS